MDFYDPKLRGLKLLLDDATDLMNWLARKAFGADHAPTMARHETGTPRLYFFSEIVWESEVWIAEFPDHMIHFNGDKFLGPYPVREKGRG